MNQQRQDYPSNFAVPSERHEPARSSMDVPISEAEYRYGHAGTGVPYRQPEGPDELSGHHNSAFGHPNARNRRTNRPTGTPSPTFEGVDGVTEGDPTEGRWDAEVACAQRKILMAYSPGEHREQALKTFDDLLEWLDDRALDEVTVDDARDYYVQAETGHRAPGCGSLSHRIRVARHIWDAFVTAGFANANIFRAVDIPSPVAKKRLGKRVKAAPSDASMRGLLQPLHDQSLLRDRRNVAIVLVIAATGDEEYVAQLRGKDIAPADGGGAQVRCGQEWRRIPLSEMPQKSRPPERGAYQQSAPSAGRAPSSSNAPASAWKPRLSWPMRFRAIRTVRPEDARPCRRGPGEEATNVRRRGRLCALHRLVAGHGYDITAADVWLAYRSAIQAAENLGRADAKKQPIRDLVSGEAGDRFVSRVLGAELDLPRRK